MGSSFSFVNLQSHQSFSSGFRTCYKPEHKLSEKLNTDTMCAERPASQLSHQVYVAQTSFLFLHRPPALHEKPCYKKPEHYVTVPAQNLDIDRSALYRWYTRTDARGIGVIGSVVNAPPKFPAPALTLLKAPQTALIKIRRR